MQVNKSVEEGKKEGTGMFELSLKFQCIFVKKSVSPFEQWHF